MAIGMLRGIYLAEKACKIGAPAELLKINQLVGYFC
ncbi:hypothetical protein Slin_2114 [Spirosoma linguale DSM 74]|uniref:Uncharacterized protein n=1 Tax=Spirosoma linguale (strain ATCC 33905 / DSM 74 / LMG 10896 / Claus 1) TaxID=504472 RepID=D2QDL8_SPILD|nr:hypothetical protein Slin_2114 [Spirosoma linguale DSM 74]